MSAAPVIRTEPLEVISRLAELALAPVLLHDAMLAGELARSSCTANDPPSFAGYSAWGVTVRALREQLIPLGWLKNDEGNYSRIESRDGAIAIVVATGDAATGRAFSSPKTNTPKGPATIRAVEANIQFDLFTGPNAPDLEFSQDREKPQTTWVLLIHRSEGEVRGELSLPLRVGDDGRIEGWSERIMLEPIRLDGDFFTMPAPEPGPEFDVDVVRLAS